MKILTPEQRQKSDERKARFRTLVKQVADMSDEQRAKLTSQIGAIVTCEGHALSLTNTMLLILQRPTVSMVGGFKQWIKQGRAVQKGEHGMMIWFPRNKKGDADSLVNTSAEPTSSDAEKPELRFLIGTVFDISQTCEIETQP